MKKKEAIAVDWEDLESGMDMIEVINAAGMNFTQLGHFLANTGEVLEKEFEKEDVRKVCNDYRKKVTDLKRQWLTDLNTALNKEFEEEGTPETESKGILQKLKGLFSSSDSRITNVVDRYLESKDN